MEGSVLSFLKAEWKVSDTGSAHWASSFLSWRLEYFVIYIYSKTCVNRAPLGPRFTAGIDSGPVYSVSTLWLPYKWFFHGSQISRFSSKLVDFFYRYLIFAILSFNQNQILADRQIY